MKDALYVKQRYEQTTCEGEVDTSKTNVFTYVKIGNLIENWESIKYIYFYICGALFKTNMNSLETKLIHHHSQLE